MLDKSSRSYYFPIVVSVALHSLLIGVLFFGWQPEPVKPDVKRPNYIEAKLVELKPQVQSKVEKEPPKVNKVDLTKKRQEQERQQKLAEEQRQKEIQRKQQEAERQKKAEAERKKKQEAERKAAEQKAAEQKAAQQKKAAEEAERQRQAEQRQKQLQQEFDQALAVEQELLAEQSYAAAAQSYMGAIRQRIEQSWNRPPSARNGMECELLIQLVPTGRVANVNIVKSSGNAAFDRSAEQAVKKAEQFPEIQQMDPEVFERYYRQFRLVFKPQDLRQ